MKRIRVTQLILPGCIILMFMPAICQAQLTSADLKNWLDSKVHNWRWHFGELPGAEKPEFDDSQWQQVDLGFKWWPHDSTGWFRTRITIPDKINGIQTQGATIRMKAGVDNAAQAYVNGVLKQDFEWSKGDFILTEHAHPGEIITVALHAINRPGSGSLLGASLVNGRGEALVEALRNLARDFDRYQEDAPYLPQAEASANHSRVREAMQALDVKAYQTGNRDLFLRSVDKARSVLLLDSATVESRLQLVSANLQSLKKRIRERQSAGLAAAYSAVDARVIESFLKYSREDLSENNSGHQIRGLKGLAFIERLSTHALESEEPEPVVPQYKSGPITMHDGAFWQGNRPVYFTGVGHFGQVREDIPVLNDYGLNIVQIEMGPANALPAPDKIDRESIRQNVVRCLDDAAVHNVAVNLLISPHYFPKWAFDADPAHTKCGRGFFKFCIEAPNTREVMEKWLDALMPLIAHHPALHSICLSNEPQYQGRCGYERIKFQRWLEAKWKSIENANRTYGTHFKSFEEIELPADDANYGLSFDRWRFNQERFLAFHAMLRDRIHRYDPKLPVHAKVMSHAFEDPGRFEVGIDYERFSKLDQIAGNDCVMEFTGDRPGEYAWDWQTMAMNYTLQHSAAPNSPIFNSENHLIGDGDPRYIPESYIRSVFWQQAIHGQGATTTWVWERGQSGDLAENILTRANCVHALGHMGLDLQRLAPEVHALSHAESNVGILYSYSSLLPSMDYYRSVRSAFEGAYFTSGTLCFVSEAQIKSGDIPPVKILIVPNASYGMDYTVEAANKFIQSGGIVIVIGSCFENDEYGRPRSRGLVQSGKGKLLVYTDPLTPQGYQEIVQKLLDRAHAGGPVKLVGSHNQPVWGVHARSVEFKGKLLVNILNYSREQVSVRLVTKAATKKAINLIQNKAVEFPVEVKPLDPIILELSRN